MCECTLQCARARCQFSNLFFFPFEQIKLSIDGIRKNTTLSMMWKKTNCKPTTIRINVARCEIAFIVTTPRKQLYALHDVIFLYVYLASSAEKKYQRGTKFAKISTNLLSLLYWLWVMDIAILCFMKKFKNNFRE